MKQIASLLRDGDILEPDGTEVIKVDNPDDLTTMVTIKEPGKRPVTYVLDPLWPIHVRENDHNR